MASIYENVVGQLNKIVLLGSENMRLKNKTNGVEGEFIKKYWVTGRGYTTMVRCDDGRKYYAPSDEWVLVK